MTYSSRIDSGNVFDCTCCYFGRAIADEGCHIQLYVCSIVEGRERPWKNMTSFPEGIALVVVISERERVLVVGFVETRTVMSWIPWAGNRGLPRMSIECTFSESGSDPQMISPRFSSSNAVTARPPSRWFATPRDPPRRTVRLHSRGAGEVGRRLGAACRRR